MKSSSTVMLFLFLANLFFSTASARAVTFVDRQEARATKFTNRQDLSALRSLYASLGAPKQLYGWSHHHGDPCNLKLKRPWRGVSCSGPRVVSINLKGLGLGGFFSPNTGLSAFTSLEELDLSFNGIDGHHPRALPPNAFRIDLAHNNLAGPLPDSVFTNMNRLLTLDLSDNKFHGHLPGSFTSLKNLREVYLQDNRFTGGIHVLADLPLHVLQLQNNHFSGCLDTKFSHVAQLVIYGNSFQCHHDAPTPLVVHSAPGPGPAPPRGPNPGPDTPSVSAGSAPRPLLL